MNTQAITDFIIQNKKPLLLGTALVVVVIFFFREQYFKFGT